jgi:hypothetical protein
MKPQWCSRSLFDLPFYLALCTTEAMFHGELKRLRVPQPWPAFLATEHANATVHMLETPGDRQSVIACIPPGGDRDPFCIVGLIVHEAVHVWQWACEQMGEREPSVEFEAYAIQRITQNLLGEYRRQVFGV